MKNSFANFRFLINFELNFTTNIMEILTNILDPSKNPSSLGIKDCLRLIGLKEITANIYAVPKGKKPKSELLPA